MSTAVKKVEVGEVRQITGQAVTPMALIEVAMNQNADVDKLEKLWQLQQQWEANEARKAYNQAMSKFRAECPVIKKTKQAHNSKYAGLAETIEQIKPHLEACGLSHSWTTDQASGAVSVTCRVTHTLGHSESTTLFSEPDKSGSKNSIQAIGSAVTYLQRYTLSSILGLASADESDDDGNAANEVEGVVSVAEAIKKASNMEELKAVWDKECGRNAKYATLINQRKQEFADA